MLLRSFENIVCAKTKIVLYMHAVHCLAEIKADDFFAVELRRTSKNALKRDRDTLWPWSFSSSSTFGLAMLTMGERRSAARMKAIVLVKDSFDHLPLVTVNIVSPLHFDREGDDDN